MIVDELKKSILDYAITGKLTSQLDKDIPIDKLYEQLKIDNKLSKIDESEIPFVIPNGWKWEKLGNLAESTDTSSFADGPFGSNLKTQHYTLNPEVRIIQLSNIGENGWNNENEKYTTYEHLKTISRCEVNAGDFAIAKMMPAGRPIIVPNLGTKIVLGTDAVKFVPNKALNKKYLYYVMKSPMFVKQVYSEVHGITRVRTSLNKLKNYLIPLPPIEEQQRIVDKIDELFAKLDEVKPIEEELDKLKKVFSNDIKKSIIKSIMCGNLNLNNLNEKNNLITDSEIKTDNLPINWRRVKAKKILNVITGKKDANYGKSDGQYLFYTCANIPIKSPTYSFEGKNLILPGNGANVGLTIYSEEKFEAYQRTYVVNSKYDESVINLKFIYYYFVAFWNEYNKNKMYGSAIPYIKLGNLQDFEINIPPIEEQQRIVDKLEQLLPLCDDIEKLINIEDN